MKTKFLTKISALSLATGLMLSSCSSKVQTEELNNDLELTSTPISVVAGVASNDTKTATRNDFATGDTIGLYVVAYPLPGIAGKLLDDGNFIDNVEFWKVNSYVWATNTSAYYPPVEVDFYAYAPYNKDFQPFYEADGSAEKHHFTVEEDQSTEAKVRANDFMTAITANKSSTDASTSVPLTFYRRMAKINIEFTHQDSYHGSEILSVVGVRVLSAGLTAEVDMSAPYTYSLEGVQNAGTYPKPATLKTNSKTGNIEAYQINRSSQTYSYEAIVAPQIFAQHMSMIEIELKLDNGTTQKFVYASENESVECKSSHITTISLIFTDDQRIALNTVSIKGWEEVNHSGSIEEHVVYNTFALTLTNPPANDVTTVDITVEQGNDPEQKVTTVYTLEASNIGTLVDFKFDATNDAPEFYPFTITNVVYRMTNGGSATISGLNVEVEKTGNVAFRQ